MKTVREIFSKAFGEVPDVFSCHIGHAFSRGSAYHWEPIEIARITPTKFDGHWPEELTGEAKAFEYPLGPDIGDRPAESFRGFFGAEYDNCLDAEGEK